MAKGRKTTFAKRVDTVGHCIKYRRLRTNNGRTQCLLPPVVPVG